MHEALKLVPGGAVGLPSGARWAAPPHLQTVAGQLPPPQLAWHLIRVRVRGRGRGRVRVRVRVRVRLRVRVRVGYG